MSSSSSGEGGGEADPGPKPSSRDYRDFNSPTIPECVPDRPMMCRLRPEERGTGSRPPQEVSEAPDPVGRPAPADVSVAPDEAAPPHGTITMKAPTEARPPPADRHLVDRAGEFVRDVDDIFDVLGPPLDWAERVVGNPFIEFMPEVSPVAEKITGKLGPVMTAFSLARRTYDLHDANGKLGWRDPFKVVGGELREEYFDPVVSTVRFVRDEAALPTIEWASRHVEAVFEPVADFLGREVVQPLENELRARQYGGWPSGLP